MYVHCISWALKMLTGNFLYNIFVQFATLIDVWGTTWHIYITTQENVEKRSRGLTARYRYINVAY